MDEMNNKSIAQGIYEETLIEEGIFVLKFINDTLENKFFKREVSQTYIQFHFVLKGQAIFIYNNDNYRLPVKEANALLLYNPVSDLPISLMMPTKSWLLTLLVPIKKLHELFSNEAQHVPFLSAQNKTKKYYKDSKIQASLSIVLHQLAQFNLSASIRPLYFKAKVYEILSLYFNTAQDINIEKCPFLADEENVLKIKKAKDIIISSMSEPPTLQQLSEAINLPINKLKEGFKQVYGAPVFSFLLHYKLEKARQLLASGSHNVNEVGLKVGYSTASHFIAAFKKKYGVTPKKFIIGLAS